MIQGHRVAMRARLLERVGDVIEIHGGFETHRDAGNPPKASIGDHHERPPGTPSLHSSPVGDVLASSDGAHSLVRLETGAKIRFTGLQALRETGHPGNGTPRWLPRGRYSRQGSRTPRSAATASASS